MIFVQVKKLIRFGLKKRAPRRSIFWADETQKMPPYLGLDGLPGRMVQWLISPPFISAMKMKLGHLEGVQNHPMFNGDENKT